MNMKVFIPYPGSNRMIILFVAVLFTSCAFQSEHADLIVHNGRIYTMNESNQVVEAMAIRDGRIIETGPERQILNKYRADNYLDCGKRPVYPGFIDAHCHFLAYGFTLSEASLIGTTSFDDVITVLKAHATEHPDGWLIGRGWDQNDWSADEDYKGFPDNERLNELFPDRPVYLTRIDGHAVLVNQKVLDLAGIGPDSRVDGGMVEVKDGRCTGILIDNAILLADKVMPVRSRNDKVQALLKAQERCFAAGLTTVADAGLLRSDIQVIDSLQRSGDLKMRIYAMLSDVPENYDWYLRHGPDTLSDYLTVRSFKFYADGALGSRGACLLNPYEDILNKYRRKDYGLLLDDPERWKERFVLLHDMGFQVNTHAIGDSANRVILDLYGEVLGGPNDKRWRIEHAQVVDEKDVTKFREYSVIPSIQPTHATSDMGWAWERLGRNRVRRAYAYKELKDQLGIVALGTDFPVEGISPVATYYAAVYRRDLEGNPAEGFQLENGLTKEEALRGMTIWAAMANLEDRNKGSLEAGKLADMVVWDRDFLQTEGNEVLAARVVHVISGGEIVHSAGR
ncbi:MAG: amidohydrolase [Flavobacteriales bacterium]